MTPVAARLGIGLAAVGRPAYITTGRADDLGGVRSVEDMRTATAAVLDAAYAGGVRYVDTARSYGRAEEFLASWLADHPERTDLTLASKWGYRYVGDWRVDADVHEVKEHSVAAFREQRAATRGLLGDRLAVYQAHSVTSESPVLVDPDLQREMAGLRADGVRVGISTSGPEQGEVVRRALDLTVDGEPLVQVVQATWNLLEQSAGPALAEAAERGVRVVVKEGMANGRLAPGVDDPSPGARRVRATAGELGVGPDALALATALAQPWSAVVLSGAATADQVRANLAAAQMRPPEALLDELGSVTEPPHAYWQARSRRSWT